MRRDRPPGGKIASRRSEARRSAPRQQRSEQQHRAAQLADQHRVRTVAADLRALNPHRTMYRAPRPPRRDLRSARAGRRRRGCAGRWRSRMAAPSARRRQSAAAPSSCSLRRPASRERRPPSILNVAIRTPDRRSRRAARRRIDRTRRHDSVRSARGFLPRAPALR